MTQVLSKLVRIKTLLPQANRESTEVIYYRI